MKNDLKCDLWIDNASVSAERYVEVLDPGRTADVVGLLAQGTPADVERAVQSAHRAFGEWRTTSFETRAALMTKAAALIESMAGDVVELMARESGMLVPTNRAEIGMAAAIVRDNIDHSQHFLDPAQYEDEASWVGIEKRPVGVIAAIVPWNAPVILTMRKLAPALLCGNTIVIKPAPSAPFGIAQLLAAMAGLFPHGVINVIHGDADAGAALVSHPLVRKVSFTGGGNVARDIMKRAADSIKSVQFELGGNDPAIVLEDADLDDCVPKIVGGVFRRSGQFCFAIKRLYVNSAIYDSFVERMAAQVDTFRIGHPLTAGVTFGPMNNDRQYRYVKGLIERTRAAGADVMRLGKAVDESIWNTGYYLPPTLVRNAAADLEVVTSEQFGPVIPVVRVDSDEEALRYANDSELGLGSSVWSRDADRAVRIARRIEAGMTFINQAGTSRLGQKNMPFGGVKQSGIGRESSQVGLAEYVENHAINLHK